MQLNQISEAPIGAAPNTALPLSNVISLVPIHGQELPRNTVTWALAHRRAVGVQGSGREC